MNEMEKLRARLRLAIERTGLGPEEFARESGISEREVRAILDDRETVGSHRMELIHRVMRTARRVTPHQSAARTASPPGEALE